MKARTAGIFFYERTKPPPAAAPAPPRPRATDCVSHSFIIAIDIVEFIPALLHPIHFSKNKTAGSFTSDLHLLLELELKLFSFRSTETEITGFPERAPASPPLYATS
jgi:hypothetical protein